jgi:hypothetical protein
VLREVLSVTSSDKVARARLSIFDRNTLGVFASYLKHTAKTVSIVIRKL